MKTKEIKKKKKTIRYKCKKFKIDTVRIKRREIKYELAEITKEILEEEQNHRNENEFEISTKQKR